MNYLAGIFQNNKHNKDKQISNRTWNINKIEGKDYEVSTETQLRGTMHSGEEGTVIVAIASRFTAFLAILHSLDVLLEAGDRWRKLRTCQSGGPLNRCSPHAWWRRCHGVGTRARLGSIIRETSCRRRRKTQDFCARRHLSQHTYPSRTIFQESVLWTCSITPLLWECEARIKPRIVFLKYSPQNSDIKRRHFVTPRADVDFWNHKEN